MSDTMDSGGEVQDQDVSQASVDSGTQPVSQNNSLAAADIAKAILGDPAFQETMRRLAQSEKDRGVTRAEAKAEEALTQTQRLAAKLGVDPAVAQQAERELVLEQMAEEYRAGRLQPVQGNVSRDLTPSEARAKASSVLGGVSPEIREAVLAELDKQAFETADSVTNFVVSKVAARVSKPVATQASMTSPQGNAPVPTSMQALINERDKLLSSREFTTREGRLKLREIGKKMEELEKGGS